MRRPVEVMEMAHNAGITISNDIKMVPEVKNVQRLLEQETVTNVIKVLQKKKGKPQNKSTVFAIVRPAHIERMVYAMLTSDVDLNELFRAVKNYKEDS